LSVVHNIFIIVQSIASWVLYFSVNRFTKGDNCTTRSENKIILNIYNLHHDIALLISTFNQAYYLVIVLSWIFIRQQKFLWSNNAMGEWISDCCLTSCEQFIWAISWQEQATFQWDDEVHFVLDQLTLFDC